MARKDAILKMREILVLRRDALRKALAGDLSLLKELREQTAGDVVDFALDSAQDEINSQLAEVESRELASIENALERMRIGHFGVCEGCATNSDGPANALPYATLCIECQRESEKYGAGAGGDADWGRLIDNGSGDAECRSTISKSTFPDFRPRGWIDCGRRGTRRLLPGRSAGHNAGLTDQRQAHCPTGGCRPLHSTVSDPREAVRAAVRMPEQCLWTTVRRGARYVASKFATGCLRIRSPDCLDRTVSPAVAPSCQRLAAQTIVESGFETEMSAADREKAVCLAVARSRRVGAASANPQDGRQAGQPDRRAYRSRKERDRRQRLRPQTAIEEAGSGVVVELKGQLLRAHQPARDQRRPPSDIKIRLLRRPHQSVQPRSGATPIPTSP